MMHLLKICPFLSLLLTGCQAVPTPTPTPTDMRPVNLISDKTHTNSVIKQINGITPTSLEGNKYNIFKYMTYLGIRSEFYDNELVTIKNVEIIDKHNSKPYFIFDVFDSKNNKILNEKYTFSDLGIIDNPFFVFDLKVDPSKIKKERGELKHGKINNNEYSSTIFVSTGGAEPRADSMTYYTSSKKIKKNNYRSLSFSCYNKSVYMTAKQDDVFAANNEKLNIYLNFPNKVEIKTVGTTINYRNVFFKINKKVEKQLLSKKAFSIRAYPVANQSVFIQSWKSNGLAEAYSRVRFLCK